MLLWIINNLATVVICLIMAALFALAIRHLIQTSKKGGCAGCNSCLSGECSHCNHTRK